MSGPHSFEQKVLKALIDRRAQLREEIFEIPPQDWPTFQYRLGQWEENDRLFQSVSRLAKALEDPES